MLHWLELIYCAKWGTFGECPPYCLGGTPYQWCEKGGSEFTFIQKGHPGWPKWSCLGRHWPYKLWLIIVAVRSFSTEILSCGGGPRYPLRSGLLLHHPRGMPGRIGGWKLRRWRGLSLSMWPWKNMVHSQNSPLTERGGNLWSGGWLGASWVLGKQLMASPITVRKSACRCWSGIILYCIMELGAVLHLGHVVGFSGGFHQISSPPLGPLSWCQH